MSTNEQVPQSFYDHPCQRCNRQEEVGQPTTVRFDEKRQIWICLCFDEHENERVVIEPEIIRPDWSTLRTQTKRKKAG